MSVNRNVTVPLGSSAITRSYAQSTSDVKSPVAALNPTLACEEEAELRHVNRASQPGFSISTIGAVSGPSHDVSVSAPFDEFRQRRRLHDQPARRGRVEARAGAPERRRRHNLRACVARAPGFSRGRYSCNEAPSPCNGPHASSRVGGVSGVPRLCDPRVAGQGEPRARREPSRQPSVGRMTAITDARWKPPAFGPGTSSAARVGPCQSSVSAASSWAGRVPAIGCIVGTHAA
jgi:hypothetical protein